MTSPGKGELAISEPGDPPTASRGEPGSASGKVEGIVGARRLLTINTGSSSLRAALYRLREDTTDPPEIRAEASRIGGRGGGLRLADARGEIIDERRDDLPDHIAALDAVGRAYPAVPQVVCFDTAFHSRMPRVARLYALPRHLAQEGIIRYGFHGLSYEYVMEELRRLEPEAAAGRVV